MRNVAAWTVNPKTWILSSLEEPKRIEIEKGKNSQIGSRIGGLQVVRYYRKGLLGFSGVDILFPLEFSPCV